MPTPHEAARTIQRFWRYRQCQKALKKVNEKLKQQKEQVETLEDYQRQLCLVHPSRLDQWEQGRRHAAAYIIQKWFRRKRRPAVIVHPHVPIQREKPIVSTDHLAQKVLERIQHVEQVDYTQLDSLLKRYYQKQQQEPTTSPLDKALDILEQVQVLLGNEPHLKTPLDAADIALYEKECELARLPWWDTLEHPDWLTTKLEGKDKEWLHV